MVNRARSSRCCGLALFHGLMLYIVLTSLHLSPWTELSKKNYYDYEISTLTIRQASLLTNSSGNTYPFSLSIFFFSFCCWCFGLLFAFIWQGSIAIDCYTYSPVLKNFFLFFSPTCILIPLGSPGHKTPRGFGIMAWWGTARLNSMLPTVMYFWLLSLPHTSEHRK